MDGSKRKEIVDFALAERIEHLLRLCDGHVQRNSDLTRRFGHLETRIVDLEKVLVVEGSNHATCVNERSTLRARVAELESAEAGLKAKLAAVISDRDKWLVMASKRDDKICAAKAALKS